MTPSDAVRVAAAKTEMTLVASVCSFTSLQDRCRAAVARHLVTQTTTSVDALPLPQTLKQYIHEVVDADCKSTRVMDTQHGARRRRPVNVALKFWPPSDANYWPRAGWVADCVRI